MDNDKDNKEFKGIWIPKEYLDCKNLSTSERDVLSIITALDNGKGCYATNRYFGKILTLTKNHISSIINSLNEKDFISCYVDQSEGNKRIINIKHSIRKTEQPTNNQKDSYTGKSEYPTNNQKDSYTGKSEYPIRENPIHDNKDYNKVNKRERELSHFDFLNSNFPKEIEKLKEKYKFDAEQWKYLIDYFNNKRYNQKTITVTTFENVSKNWYNNLKDPIKNNSKPVYLRKIT